MRTHAAWRLCASMVIAAAIVAPTAQAADAPAEPASDSLPALSATHATSATHPDARQSTDWVLIGGVVLMALTVAGRWPRISEYRFKAPR